MTDAFAKIVLDSISPDDIRLPSLHLRYWRPIHAEFMTHRVFTRNGRSSRAVPVKTLLTEAPYVPQFAKNQPGMVAGEPLTADEQARAEGIWNYMIEACRYGVAELAKIGGTGVHKQWTNRPLEWFGYIDVLLTTTDIENFMVLRDDPAAAPEIRDLAQMMKEALAASTPTLLQPGEWHLPYITNEDRKGFIAYAEAHSQDAAENEFVALEMARDIAKKVSTARCARLSYKPFDGNGDIPAELERYERLIVSRPVHASPAEHQATPDVRILGHEGPYGEWRPTRWANRHLHGNFWGWIQNRKTIPHEAVFDAHYL
jgi:hypothetical protein